MPRTPITCLLEKVKAGLVDEAQAKRVEDLTNRYFKALEKEVGSSSEAMNQASRRALESITEDLDSTVKKALNSAARVESLSTLSNLDGRAFNNEIYRKVFMDAAITEKMFRNKFGRHLEGFMRIADQNKLSRTIDPKLYDDATQAFFGGKAASEEGRVMAMAMRNVVDEINSEMYRAGYGRNYIKGLGTSIRQGQLRKVTAPEFIDDVLRNGNRDDLTALSAKIGHPIEIILDTYFNGVKRGPGFIRNEIVKLGYSDNPAGFMSTVRKHIVLDNFESFKNFNGKYGLAENGIVDSFAHIMDIVLGSAREASLLNFYGGSTLAVRQKVLDLAKSKGFDDRALDMLGREFDRSEQYLTGQHGYNSDPFWRPALFERNNINFYPKEILDVFRTLGSMFLGSTVLAAAPTDLISTSASALASFGKGARLSRGAGFKTESRYIAARLGLSITTNTELYNSTVRGIADSIGSPGLDKFVQYFIRSTGLVKFTDAGRLDLVRNAALDIAEMTSMKFDDLSPTFKETLSRNLIDSSDWELIRQHGLQEVGEWGDGVFAVTPNKLWSNPDPKIQKLGDKISGFLADLEERGIPTESIWLKRFVAENSNSPLGSILASSASQFLSYPTSYFDGTLRHIYSRSTPGGGFRGVAALISTMTMAGMMAQMMYDIKDGKTPDLNSSTYWQTLASKGWARGGAGGLYGDLILDLFETDSTRSMQAKIGGVVMGQSVNSISDLLFNIAKITKGDVEKGSRGVFDQLFSYSGSSHWALKALTTRAIRDPLVSAIDPNYGKYLRRSNKQAKKEGAPYFWER